MFISFVVPPRLRPPQVLGDERRLRPGRGNAGHAATARCRDAPALSGQREGMARSMINLNRFLSAMIDYVLSRDRGR